MIFAICGRANSGKNTLANMLIDALLTLKEAKYITGKIDQCAFADPIKEILATTFNTSVESIEDYKRSDARFDICGSSSTMREILQRFGTDACQEIFGQKIWVKLLLNRVTDIDHVVITDCRFSHELEALENAYGLDNVCLIKVLGGDTNSHISENDLISKPDKFFDCVFDNRDHKGDIAKAVADITGFIVRNN